MGKKRFLIIPIEVKVRDFMSRLLLSVYASSRNYNVIIGSQQKIFNFIDKLPKAIYFDKSLSLNKKLFFKKLVSKGFKICSIDEEGLSSINNYQKYITQRVSKETLKLAERIFTWGNSEAKIIVDKYPEVSNKVKVTGNPRLDLLKKGFDLKYGLDASQYNDKYGEYIFFPSNFTVNHALGEKNLQKLFINLGRVASEEDEVYYSKRLEYFRKTFKEYVSLVIAVAKKYKNKNIIVRPHPAEDKGFWKKLSSNYKNIFIRSENEAAGWIKGASVIIHSSCTTGLEAFFSDKHVISFLPYKDHEYAKHISNIVSHECNNEKDVLEYLEDIFSSNIVERSTQNIKDEISKHIHNIDNNFAFKNLINEIEKIDIEKQYFKPININFSRNVISTIKKIKTYLFDRKTFRYGLQKFPGISKKEFDENYLIIRKILNINKKIETVQLSKDLFMIKPK